MYCYNDKVRLECPVYLYVIFSFKVYVFSPEKGIIFGLRKVKNHIAMQL